MLTLKPVHSLGGGRGGAREGQGEDVDTTNGGGDEWFTTDLEERTLLDAAWLTGMSYKTERVHSVTCTDTRGCMQRGGAQSSPENRRGSKTWRMRAAEVLSHP